MISDVFHDAVCDLDRYLEDKDGSFSGIYSGELRERIIAVRDEMETIRVFLDCLPPMIPAGEHLAVTLDRIRPSVVTKRLETYR